MSRFFIGIAVIAAALIAGAGIADAQQARAPVPLRAQPGAVVKGVDLAQAGRSPINLEIVTACVNGVATFKILNRGDSWPALGTLNIVQVTPEGMRTIVKREMRFAEGQKGSFRLKKPGQDKLALFVEPSWYERPFEFDAEVSCE